MMALSKKSSKFTNIDRAKLHEWIQTQTGLDPVMVDRVAVMVNSEMRDRAVAAAKKGAAQYSES